MRTRNALVLGAAAALITSAVVSGSAAIASRGPQRPVPAPLAASNAPAEDRSGDRPADHARTCGKASDPVFPIRTRIHGGPATVRVGSGFHSWSVDLTNSTRETCHRIHPVLVLTAQDRGLTEDRVTLEFYDEDADRWRPVVLEETSEDEIVGVFDGFQGFVVPAGGTVTVRTRLSLDAGTPSNTVTVNAAVVQRKGDDGDWVGASGDERFTVVAGEGGRSAEPRPARPTADPSPSGSPTPAATPAGVSPSRSGQLATTGSGPLTRIGVGVGGAILLGAGVLALLTRRRRRPRPRPR
ncbi:hypothetical protein GLX30_22480 [Streptomyces sp. Tu 2975]|uniref:hypothetical protein n=1 Tax=Streptomyces sp. Tu 2975 TaxID=2676871 RepID=UPI0013597F58|nr:hypothetical protein [Streptomyces sp. Tu 2975]QIP86331.1 hypothetical protein GLX30_22480 [Streptomyces sp. Tu 2975]